MFQTENSDFKVKRLFFQDYRQVKDEVVSLYLHAFTSGEYAQYMQRDDAEAVLQGLMAFDNAAIVTDRNKIVGLIIGMPFLFDKEFPKSKTFGLTPKKTLYIAEVLVHSDARGRGIASQLIAEFLKFNERFDAAVIRVWDKNIPAISLYKKMGFREIAQIIQTKWKSQTENFEMKKLYLYRILN